MNDTRHILDEVVEDLMPRFAREVPRPVIQRCAAEVIVDLRDSIKTGELRDVADLVTTYRLAAVLGTRDEDPSLLEIA